MKRIKNLLLIVFATFTMFSCTDSVHQQTVKEKTYFLDEDFMIIKTTESPKMWVIQRIKSSIDSIEVAELDSKEIGNNFYITKELWYNKEVGSVLHFDYILRNRFIKIKSTRKSFLLTGNDHNTEKELLKESFESSFDEFLDTDEETVVELDDLETERKLDDLERQLQLIQDQIDRIRDELNEDYY